jgi:hypothetical protein
MDSIFLRKLFSDVKINKSCTIEDRKKEYREKSMPKNFEMEYSRKVQIVLNLGQINDACLAAYFTQKRMGRSLWLNWKLYEMIRTWYILRYYSNIRLEGLKKTTRNLRRFSVSLGRQSNIRRRNAIHPER